MANLDLLQKLVEKARAAVSEPHVPQQQVETSPTEQSISTPHGEESAQKPAPPKVRDLRKEIEWHKFDQLSEELFVGLHKKESDLRHLLSYRDPDPMEREDISRLKCEIEEIKSAIMADPDLYPNWMATAMDSRDEFRVSVDLEKWGVLSRIDLDQKLEIDHLRGLRKKELESNSNRETAIPKQPTVFAMRVVSEDGKTVTDAFFIKREHMRGEKTPADGYGRLFNAYFEHWRAKWEYGKTVNEQIAKMKKALGAENSPLTLLDVSQGTAGVIALDVTPQHDWHDRDGRPLTGCVVIECLGDDGTGVSTLKILAAEGTVRYSVRSISNDKQVLLEYMTGRRFEGLNRVDTHLELRWLRQLFLRFLPQEQSDGVRRPPLPLPEVQENTDPSLMPTRRTAGIGRERPGHDGTKKKEKTYTPRGTQRRQHEEEDPHKLLQSSGGEK